jgi:hypothetical protein
MHLQFEASPFSCPISLPNVLTNRLRTFPMSNSFPVLCNLSCIYSVIERLVPSRSLVMCDLLQCDMRSGRFPLRFEAEWISRVPGRAEDGEETSAEARMQPTSSTRAVGQELVVGRREKGEQRLTRLMTSSVPLCSVYFKCRSGIYSRINALANIVSFH